MDKKKGDALLKIARNSIKLAFDDKDFDLIRTHDKDLCQRRGAFVTLFNKIGKRRSKQRELRGCIGFIGSKLPLWGVVAEAARLAAFEDPRFPPLCKGELDKISIEISVISKLQRIDNREIKKPSDIAKQIEIGKDGLMIEYSGFSGLLLPQVAVEYGWNEERFLEETCIKAGISPKDWKEKGCRIYKFQAQIFSE